jgi:hypothetical protein
MSNQAAGRSRTRTGVAASVLLHALFLTAAVLSLPHKGPPPEPRAFEVSLEPLAQPSRRTPVKPRAQRPAPAAPATAPRPTVPAPSPLPAQPGPAPGEGQDLANIRGLLRGSVGCSEETFLRLTRQERDHCARWRQAQIKPGLEIPAPMAAEKRAWYDATVAARNAPDHPPGVVCFGKPAHGLKLGPLPCYVEPPKGPLTEDVDAPPEPSR